MWWHGRNPVDDEPLTVAEAAELQHDDQRWDLDAYLARIRDARVDDLAAAPRRRPDELDQLPLFR